MKSPIQKGQFIAIYSDMGLWEICRGTIIVGIIRIADNSIYINDSGPYTDVDFDNLSQLLQQTQLQTT